ncbi:Phenylacetate--CoA ligase [Desulfarculus baarsii DSM 2075]|uniref:Phenylacetate-coenzyme A ligase n=1 Tax=Desulfarculus baarsii (strain ATCC 33931 / DSM 2075 / LMG 7858 / VKM B-1802 / 2st14) TaxID=644282 RepID=E1QE13_DESB2|nr:Phenylacetate--CoA ligase [Desulfarculus baarsii DSM 2075]
MMFWNQEIETLERGKLEQLQLQRLNKTLLQAANAPFYKDKLTDSAGRPVQLKSLEELAGLPFTEKKDLRAGFPYGHLATPRRDVVRVHVSSGTTGVPTAVYHTQSDLDNWTDLVARCLYMAGMRADDIFQNMIGYGLFTGGLGLHYGAERLGAMVIPSGVGNTSRQLSLIRQFAVSAVHVIPSYALKLLDSLREMKLDPRDLGLRLLIVGAEPYTEEARQRIEHSYGAFACNSYGLSEVNGPGVAFECPHKNGMHLWEDNYILEVINPETLEPVADGQQGELVLTTLCRQAMPLIRYRTRDLCTVLPGPCACGRTHRRISRIAGRTDDMFIIKGVNVYPMQVEATLMGFKEVGNDYVIVLTNDGPVDYMTVRVEIAERYRTMDSETMAKLSQRLGRALRDELLVSTRVELLPPESIPAVVGKAVRVDDRRKH